MADLIWLHEGALRRTHPVFAMAAPGTPALFIWDDDRFAAAHVGTRRRIFILETLEELGVDLVDGDAAGLMPRLVAAHGTTRLLMPASPDPVLLRQAVEIRQALPDLKVEMVDDTPFVSLPKEPDLARFFRYWNKARKTALRPHGV